ncbi:MAG: hypothetical protein JSV86_00785 [Gemmatimonadota bacterium]|nr:MAG: hypothetical protein JSV86_00785 [Gemmatimonadota bacterium]
MLRAILVLGTLLSFAGCKDEAREETGISREDYIETYLEILLAAEAAADSFAATDSALAVLARRGLTEQDLLDFARRYRDDPGYLADIWQEIEERLEPEETPEERPTPEERRTPEREGAPTRRQS